MRSPHTAARRSPGSFPARRRRRPVCGTVDGLAGAPAWRGGSPRATGRPSTSSLKRGPRPADRFPMMSTTTTTSPAPALDRGPFTTSEAAVRAAQLAGDHWSEVVQLASGAWYLQERRERQVPCSTCRHATWSVTGLCVRHRENAGMAGLDLLGRVIP